MFWHILGKFEGYFGQVIQPMRSNIRGVPLPQAFLAYNGEGPHSRQLQHREDEIERLTLWARIAPPFGVAKHGQEQAELGLHLGQQDFNHPLHPGPGYSSQVI